MPSLKAIQKRIGSVKNTQKITKAMKMVAAAKLRRAQQAAQNARHYAKAIWGLALRLSQKSETTHPLTLSVKTPLKRDYLVFTSDRGLCGGFNSNLLRKLGDALEKCREEKITTTCRIIGKRGKDYFKAKNWDAAESATDLYENLTREMAKQLAEVATRRFESGKADEVYLVHNYFKSTMVQQVIFERVLPLSPPSQNRSEKIPDTIFEPKRDVVLDKLLRESLVAKVYGAFLESMASELAARMTAMDSATNNASDMIEYLTLQFNRARQAAITRELMDIVNGAEALR